MNKTWTRTQIDKDRPVLKTMMEMVEEQNALWHTNEDKAAETQDEVWERIGKWYNTLNFFDRCEFDRFCK